MNLIFFIILINLVMINICFGETYQNNTPTKSIIQKEKSKSVWKTPLFVEKKEVNTIKKNEDVTVNRKQKQSIEENIWAEPTIGADGKVSIYVPPKAVLEFLQNPTSEKYAEKYIEWNQKRLDDFVQAEETLARVAYKKGLITAQSGGVVGGRERYIESSDNFTKKGYVAFFLLKGCPYCEQQKKLILQLRKNAPNLKIEVFVKNYLEADIKKLSFPVIEDNGVSESLGFNTYPTTIVINAQGQKNLLPGVITERILKGVL